MTMFLGTPFLANIVLNIYLTVVVFLSFTFITSGQPSMESNCCILTFDPAQNAIQGDAPEGSDIFQWQLGEEIAWAEID